MQGTQKKEMTANYMVINKLENKYNVKKKIALQQKIISDNFEKRQKKKISLEQVFQGITP